MKIPEWMYAVGNRPMIAVVLAMLSLALVAMAHASFILMVNGQTPIHINPGVYAVDLKANEPIKAYLVLYNVSGPVQLATRLDDPVITIEYSNGTTQMIHGNAISLLGRGTLVIRVIGFVKGQGLLMSVILPNDSFVLVDDYSMNNTGSVLSIDKLVNYLSGIGSATKLTLALMLLLLILVISVIAWAVMRRRGQATTYYPPLG